MFTALQIEQIKDTIITFFKERNVSFSKIISFLSYINGIPTKESDVDLLILSAEFENKNIFHKAKFTDGLERILVKKFKLPFDITYNSNSGWNNSNYLIITEAKKTGSIKYS